GAVVAVVTYFLPVLLFSGEFQIYGIIDNPIQIGIEMLLLLAILKVLLLAISFKGGYIGGPVFPILFSSTLIALAINLAFPFIPISILVLCIEVGAIALALGAPLTAILLVVVVGTADQYMIVLVVVSAVTALIIADALRRVMVRRSMKSGRTVAIGQEATAVEEKSEGL
ncbi:MAG TPA: chloride channel protein, partial [Methanomicrobiales archaeon]|nr:chloride channel protein [Methanomicrobiales archaeon]